MLRLISWILWIFGGLSVLLSLALLLLLLTANTPFGRTTFERAVGLISGGIVQLSGLDGDIASQVSIERIVLQDANGTWLTLSELQLDWQPSKLLSGQLDINRLQARNIKLERLPVSKPSSTSSTELTLPLPVDLRSLIVDRLELAPSLIGEVADFGINGKLKLSTINRGEVELQINRLQKQGIYSLQAKLSDDALDAHLSLQEWASGPLAKLVGLSNQEDLNLNASLSGPLAAIHSHMELKLDNLLALLDGDINWLQNSIDLKLTAKSPAMKLRTELAWQAMALNLSLNGPLTELNAYGGVQLDKLNVGSSEIGRLAFNLQGTNGQLTLAGELADLVLSTTKSDLLQAEPLLFQASVDLAKPDFSSTLTLKHRLIAANGQATLKGAMLDVTLPNLQPFATIAGLKMPGSAKLALKYENQQADKQLNIEGQLNFGVSDNVWSKVLGEASKLDLAMTMQGNDIKLSGLHLNGKSLSLSAGGTLIAGYADFNWQAQLDNFSAFSVGKVGRINTQGRLNGQLDDFNLSSELNGELASQAYPNENIAGNLQLQHMPYRTDGLLTLKGIFLKAPVDMQLTVTSPSAKSIKIAIDQANWKSAQAKGGLLFTLGSSISDGKIDLKIKSLNDLQPLLKQRLSGSGNVSLETTMHNGVPQAKLMLSADNAALEGSMAIDHTKLELNISDPVSRPALNGMLELNDFNTGKLNGTAKIKLDGTLDALNLGLSIGLSNLSESAAELSASALLNVHNSSALFSAMQVTWQQQTLRLQAPAKFNFLDGLSVDRLRVALDSQQAELELAGRILPDLALTVDLQQISAELLSQFAAIPAISGKLHADANLHGSLLQPTGLVHINADRLQFKDYQGLPPAQFTASAVLDGESVDLDAALKAGGNIDLRISGQTPMNDSGLFAMQSEAALDLKLLDPILNASGRRLRGKLTANTQLAGNWSSPLLSGTAQIDHGDWQDFSSGVGISDISAALAVEEGKLNIVKMDAHAGPGTLSLTGGIDLLTAGMPIDLTITAHNARPLASDRLTVNLDGDVVLGGDALGQITANGRIHLNRVDIQIPDRLSANIAVLKLSSDKPEIVVAVPKESSNFLLNLTIEAPQQIFIRGRGVDAELGGTVKLTGDIKHLHPDGDFKLRRGQYTLAGQVLVFNQGSVGFDNNSLTNPTLNFVAISTRNNITATVIISGSVRQLKIALSSTPILPQDEVLANLLFSKGTASLSPLEMVQISTALASLTGVTSGIGDPLDNARKFLGLDRLSVGGVNPTLEAGRYIAPGVYLGAKQGVSGGAPQPVIQIDLTQHLKLEGGVGSGAAASSSAGSASTNSLGLIYQIEY